MVTLNLHRLFVAAESITLIFFIFWPNKIHVRPTGIVSFVFPPGAASPLADVATSPHRVSLPSHGAKTNSQLPLHFLVTLHSVASPLELKLKH
jgi:hypothetical protein